MSAESDVAVLLAESADAGGVTPEQTVEHALEEVKHLLAASGQSIFNICSEAETATEKIQLRAILRRFTRIVRVLLEAASGPDMDPLASEALLSLEVSDRFSAFLSSGVPIAEAVTLWKKDVIRDLAISIRRREALGRQFDAMDDELFAEAFPVTDAPVIDLEEVKESAVPDAPITGHRLVPQKRRSSQFDESTAAPAKRSRIPALAAIDKVAEALASASSKKALVTREKLRAGMHDPRVF